MKVVESGVEQTRLALQKAESDTLIVLRVRKRSGQLNPLEREKGRFNRPFLFEGFSPRALNFILIMDSVGQNRSLNYENLIERLLRI